MAAALPPKFCIKPATTHTDLTAIKSLFNAYATSIGIDLTFQNFAHELHSLPGLYAPPTGAVFLAFASSPSLSPGVPKNIPSGCVALRPLPLLLVQGEGKSKKCCEMKRLFCVPWSRGSGVGRALVEGVIKEAEKLGYEEMRLDTIESMVGARRLYESLGFGVCERYYDTPLEGTVFLSRRLGSQPL
jgi:hypothetical protein